MNAETEVLMLESEPLFTIRAYDGDKPPKLRSAPMTDALNAAARRIAGGDTGRITVNEVEDVRIIGIQFGAMEETTELVRVTSADVEIERARGDLTATVDSLADTWASAIRGALSIDPPDAGDDE